MGVAYLAQARLAAAQGDEQELFHRVMRIAALYRFLRKLPSRAPSTLYLKEMLRNVLEPGRVAKFLSVDHLIAFYNAIPPPTPVHYSDFVRLQQEYTIYELPAVLELREAFSNPNSEAFSTAERDLFFGEYDEPTTLSCLDALFTEARNNLKLPWKRHSWKACHSLRQLVKRLPEPPETDDRTPKWEELWLRATYAAKMKPIPNALGLRLFLDAVAEQPRDLVADVFYTRNLAEESRMCLILYIFQRSFRRLPKVVDELNRLRLKPPLPMDVYAETPYHYDHRRGIFWSVGENGVDDHGAILRGSPGDLPPDWVCEAPHP
jgi:hypothetical protein